MSNNMMHLQINDIEKMLENNEFPFAVIVNFQNNSRVSDYLIDDKYILRISRSELSEKERLEIVQSITFVPKIHISGTFDVSGDMYYFIVIDYVKGEELLSVLQTLTTEQNIQIGKDIAKFLMDLNRISDSCYDIGHYIPTISRFSQSWREGHLKYVESLRSGISDLDLSSESKSVARSAFEYIQANIHTLEYQAGPRILHNDLHPKNIIIHQGKLAGIIDWECSQYGESDFEIAHLFHWGIYPLKPEEGFETILRSLFENHDYIRLVPKIEKRLTIYQLEHELNQLIWNGKNQEELRIRRIHGWLNGQIENLLNQWSAN
ncbi:MAG TPA: hypothetical protein DCQ90_08200 [Erysipelotrichaceae bacterium]|nr:hypothetical protein [Erysipelotrichaceae bacterium]